jgi:hypothetical protein
MEHGLAQISAHPQVGGAFICDNRGEVIVSSSPAVLATVTMSTMGREVGRIVEALEGTGRSAARLDFTYSNWRLLAVDLSDAILLVVCEATADISFVRMTTDVVLTSWRRDAEVQRRLKRHRVERGAAFRRAALTRPAAPAWGLEPSRH